MFPERLNYLPKSKNQKLSVLVAASLIFVTCLVSDRPARSKLWLLSLV